MRKAVNIIAINNKKILLVKKRQTWILPGGKPEGSENDFECLVRELSEELSNVVIVGDFNFYKSFVGKTPHSGDELEAKTYFGKIIGDTHPSAEINEAKWFDNFDNIQISDITSKIITSLQSDGYI